MKVTRLKMEFKQRAKRWTDRADCITFLAYAVGKHWLAGGGNNTVRIGVSYHYAVNAAHLVSIIVAPANEMCKYADNASY